MKTDQESPLCGRRVLVAVSGSIAAVKTPLLVSALVKAGAEVRCLVTSSGAALVSPVALASLSRQLNQKRIGHAPITDAITGQQARLRQQGDHAREVLDLQPVPLHRRVAPHGGVHRRGGDHRTFRCQQDAGKQAFC